MTENREGAKVSKFSRVLAWIFLACAFVVVADIVISLVVDRPMPMKTAEIVGLLVGLLIIGPLFLFVAVKGRSPKWMSSIEHVMEDEAEARGIPSSDGGRMGLFVPAVASIVFGVMLFFFGNRLHLFSDETGWFAMVIFATCWLIVTIVLWRVFRRGKTSP